MNIRNLSWLTRAPLLLAAAALAACSSDEQPAAQAEPEQHQWTLVVSASKTDAEISDATRGVKAGTGETLSSMWTAGTTVEVYDGETCVGTLLADASVDGTTQLRGSISGTYTPGVSTLQLYSPSKTLDYSGQDGSISGANGISTKDFVCGTVTVQSVNMRNNMMTTDDCQFTRLQAFTKFTFDFAMKSLQITADGLVGSPLTVTAASETATYYVALRNTEPGVKKQYSFYGTSADGTTTFIGTKYGTLMHGDYSRTSVTLQPSIENGNTSTWGATPGEENLGDIYL